MDYRGHRNNNIYEPGKMYNHVLCDRYVYRYCIVFEMMCNSPAGIYLYNAKLQEAGRSNTAFEGTVIFSTILKIVKNMKLRTWA
jgi:hypothetical protein